jgi:glutaminase
LAQVPGNVFGVCVVSIRGNVYEVGDTQYEFSIMSVSKPFVFALVDPHVRSVFRLLGLVEPP